MKKMIKDEGFHMEKSYTSKEIKKLTQIDRAKFKSQFTYYNAILKSFKVFWEKNSGETPTINNVGEICTMPR